MIIRFNQRKLAKVCEKGRNLVKEFGTECAQKLQHRLDDLAAADCLADLNNSPGRLHELEKDLKGIFSLDLKHPYRLLFVPDHDPRPLRPDGSTDRSEVKRVLILRVEDTHG